MTEKQDKESTRTKGTLFDATRMVMLAAVGAASLAQDEMMSYLDRLVERGEMAESDARKLVREIMDRREKMDRERKQQDEKKQSASTAATKADVEALTARIAELTRQIEEMKKAE